MPTLRQSGGFHSFRPLVCFVIFVLGVAVAGCGSGDGPTAGPTTETGGAATKTGGEHVETAGEKTETGVAQHGATGVRDDQNVGGARSGTGRGDDAGRLPTSGPVALERMAKHCPTSFGESTCRALVEAAGKPRDGSHEVVKTGDCTEVLTKADCEAIYAVRDQVAEAPDSVLMSGAEFKECLKNLTPRCEKLLGPILERQRQFEESQEAGG